ncbi:MAG: hypothetical protein ACLTTP_08090 [Alistipes ihumii]
MLIDNERSSYALVSSPDRGRIRRIAVITTNPHLRRWMLAVPATGALADVGIAF